MSDSQLESLRPSGAYTGGTYAVLAIGSLGFCLGLWNAELALSEKGYYFITLLFGMFAAISLQRVNRDKAEGLPVSSAYVSTCYAALAIALAAIVTGLWNAELMLSEKGFYVVSFILSMFSVITVQKNVRDIQLLNSLSTPRVPAPRQTPPTGVEEL